MIRWPMRTTLAVVLIGVAFAAACTGGGKQPSADITVTPTAIPHRLSVAYTPVSGVTLPLWIALEEGFFHREGLDSELDFRKSPSHGQENMACFPPLWS
jgi:ABC-type nitrate/sulfonate/bicarbonate transport system substrate-binding protein